MTRLNGSEFLLNPTLIETVEATPDTVISLTTGKKLVIRESVEQVKTQIIECYQTIGLVGLQNRQRTEG